MALDLSIQCPWRCRWDCSHAHQLAQKRENIQEAQYFLAVDPTGGLVGRGPTAGSFHINGIRNSRRREHSICLEQRDHYFHLDFFWSSLDRFLRLDVLAIVWVRAFQISNLLFPISRRAYGTCPEAFRKKLSNRSTLYLNVEMLTLKSSSNVHRLRAIFPFTIALSRPIGPAIMYVHP